MTQYVKHYLNKTRGKKNYKLSNLFILIVNNKFMNKTRGKIENDFYINRNAYFQQASSFSQAVISS